MRNRRAPLSLAPLFLVIAALLTPAQEARASADESLDCAQRMVWAANDRGYRIRSQDTDYLQQGQVMNYTVTLSQGVDYVILACGDRAALDLDIYVYDENGNLIDRDRERDNRPVVTISPRWTGTFLVRVGMYSSRGPGYFSLGVMYK